MVDGKEALALYESNWRHLDVGQLDDEEKAFLDTLVARFGNGVLNV